MRDVTGGDGDRHGDGGDVNLVVPFWAQFSWIFHRTIGCLIATCLLQKGVALFETGFVTTTCGNLLHSY